MPKSTAKRPKQPRPARGRKPAQALVIVPYDQLSDYRKSHYGKHVVYHPSSQVGQPRGNPEDRDVVSSTKLVGPQATSEEVFEAGSRIASLTGNGVLQYQSGSEILKVTMVGDSHVEVTVFSGQPNSAGQYELKSTYDEISLADAQANVHSRKWR